MNSQTTAAVISIHAADSQKLPIIEGKPLLFLCNRWRQRFDEEILNTLLIDRYPMLKIINTDVGKKNPFYAFPDFLTQKNMKSAIPILKKAVAHSIEYPPVFAMPVSFSSPLWGDMVHQTYLNLFFKTARDAGFTIVLLHLSSDDDMSDFDSLMQRVQRSMGSHLIKKLMLIQRTPIAVGHPRNVKVRISSPILPTELHLFKKAHEVRRFIQSRLFAMESPAANLPNFFERWSPKKEDTVQEPIIQPIDKQLIKSEIAALTEGGHLVISQSNFDVFVAAASQIPNVLQEIGRLREQTFRDIAEGTGRALDIDEFDLYYHQLIIWDRNAERIVGGYRIGCGDEIFKNYGKYGFYISTLFKIKIGFYPILQRSLELGRSFIVFDYQRKPLPLFLLWKGILAFLLQNPQYRYLFGPVSMSRQFSNVSRSLVVDFLKTHYFNPELAVYLKPRKPFKIPKGKVDTKLLVKTFGGDLGNLDKFIEGIETEQLRMPVLMRQYIRQNARFVGFNIDPKFSDCLDGFIILNLKDIPKNTIENLQRTKTPVE